MEIAPRRRPPPTTCLLAASSSTVVGDGKQICSPDYGAQEICSPGRWRFSSVTSDMVSGRKNTSHKSKTRLPAEESSLELAGRRLRAGWSRRNGRLRRILAPRKENMTKAFDWTPELTKLFIQACMVDLETTHNKSMRKELFSSIVYYIRIKSEQQVKESVVRGKFFDTHKKWISYNEWKKNPSGRQIPRRFLLCQTFEQDLRTIYEQMDYALSNSMVASDSMTHLSSQSDVPSQLNRSAHFSSQSVAVLPQEQNQPMTPYQRALQELIGAGFKIYDPEFETAMEVLRDDHTMYAYSLATSMEDKIIFLQRKAKK